MAKRFTDTNKWKKIWFRKLKPLHKCFWIYLCDNCNHAGIWDVDYELAEFFLQEKIDVNEIENVFKKQYLKSKSGKKWLIIDFIEYQYGDLNPANRAHNSVINILKREGAYKAFISSIQGRKDKDKEKDKEKDKVKDDTYIFKDRFNIIVNKYPNKDGLKMAEKHFKNSVKTEQDWININKALDNYLQSKHVKEGFIKNCSTWFNNWTDWIDQKSQENTIVKF